MRLEGGCFNFRGSRLLLQLPLTVGLTSDALTYSHPSDWELRFNPHMLCLPQLWVGGVYLYPFILQVIFIQNHSLHLLGTFFSQKDIFLLSDHTLMKMLVGGSEVPWGPCPFGPLRMCGA